MSNDIRNHAKEVLGQNGGFVTLGESASYNWIDDPARLLFSLSRYKFVAKAFEGFTDVLEVGSADGMGAYLVSKYVAEMTCIDIDNDLIESARMTVSRYAKNVKFEAGNIEDANFLRDRLFNGIFLLDVLEHIPARNEDRFIRALTRRLHKFGTMIIGMPSLESQIYASALSKMGHINCKTQIELKNLCESHFHAVFMFGANDEIIHTGFPSMQHYRLALCVGPKK
jgi:2-polyprenyl-3-methyl-5-hydroxy-6-metoxy-1,4-benzoquinol methylase